ncbi:Vacuolar protein-sorting-associated protein 25 [Sphaceloma murrayae]|uniref:ESCRT-II complex subunit VPS25 n=1 Tax=Sphaceloma murrayae TaxID=2082308 RepID=A0A2K1QHB0_9PEZI|nr:Vacuolar protein-sorting-associated protein 25 [Sphaceloma murrayae]
MNRGKTPPRKVQSRGSPQPELPGQTSLSHVFQLPSKYLTNNQPPTHPGIMETLSFSSSPAPPTNLTNPSPSSPHPSTAQPTDTFPFPPHHSFPPFFTLQPNLTTLSRQLALWSSLVQSYCSHHRLFRLSLPTAPSLPLFSNPRVHRHLDLLSIRRLIDYMTSAEGDRRAEWILPLPTSSSLASSVALQGTSSGKRREAHTIPNELKTAAYVWWKTPEEWADVIYAWVEGTGQKGSVLTVYELREGEEVARQDWVGMEDEGFRRCLDVLVKRGKAQVFGEVEGAGVKFF